MLGLRLLCAAPVACCIVNPALAQSVVVQTFKFAHHDDGPLTKLPAKGAAPATGSAASAARLSAATLPHGMPGFYDPAGRTFTPLDLPPPSVLKYEGVYTVTVAIEPGGGIAKGDTAICTGSMDFGNLAGTPEQFFANHHAYDATNFGVGDTGDLHFKYTYVPNAYNSKFQFNINCEIPYASDGSSHTAKFISAPAPNKDGNFRTFVIAHE